MWQGGKIFLQYLAIYDNELFSHSIKIYQRRFKILSNTKYKPAKIAKDFKISQIGKSLPNLGTLTGGLFLPLLLPPAFRIFRIWWPLTINKT